MIVNGTTYPGDLPESTCLRLETYRLGGKHRLRFIYDGWAEEGYVNRSTGSGITRIETTRAPRRVIWERGVAS